ncbi:MAG TPA: hypothetical protein VMW20_05685, partial [Candidatus Nanoarchaeia archaeon]|nr:hypothetical protein [Candidatus Nanoarchaeia archaeon]
MTVISSASKRVIPHNGFLGRDIKLFNMAYYKSEMGRRGFFKKAFALGAVALVPHSIFTEVENDPSFVQEKVTVKELNFGDYRAVLVR